MFYSAVANQRQPQGEGRVPTFLGRTNVQELTVRVVLGLGDGGGGGEGKGGGEVNLNLKSDGIISAMPDILVLYLV